MTPSDAFLRLALTPGLGPRSAEELLAAVAEPGDVFGLSMQQLQRVDGIGARRARQICDPKGKEAVERERAVCHEAGIRIVTRADVDYPVALRALPDPPLAIWQRGELLREDRLAVAVVGPRRPSAYGHRMAQRLAAGLARIGCCVVSGLARGIDTVAHEAALEARGRTVAVIGSGFQYAYPEENRPLIDRIVQEERGAVLSELPWAVRPSPGTFPRRNRIVAALSLATLVVEAGYRSGALITARLASELGRDVLALPGPVDRPEHEGSNKLLRDGATLITNLDDIIEEIEPLATLAQALPEAPEDNPRIARLSQRERDLYALLDHRARSVDEIHRICGLALSIVSATLLSLELRRLARKEPGGYVRCT